MKKLEKLEQREAENLVVMLLGCKLPLTHEALKAAYRNAVRRLRPDLANNKQNDEEFIHMKDLYSALLDQEPIWAFVDSLPLTKTVEGTPLNDLGLGLGSRKNGTDCKDCNHKGYTEHHPTGYQRCSWCFAGFAYSQPCLRCSGTGNGPKQVPNTCPQCLGRGIKEFSRVVRCGQCDGSGGKQIKEKAVEYHTCYKCLGTGEIEIFNPVIPKGFLIGKER